MLFHPIAGRWGPACLRAATAPVETVSPPLELYFNIFGQSVLAVAAESLMARKQMASFGRFLACLFTVQCYTPRNALPECQLTLPPTVFIIANRQLQYERAPKIAR